MLLKTAIDITLYMIITYLSGIEVIPQEEPEQVKVMFEVSAYCNEPYNHICNGGYIGQTSTGTIPTVGRTIAVDPKIIPYGTELIIDGHTYIAEDTGGAIKGYKLDLLFGTHQEALSFGRQQKEVTIKKEEVEQMDIEDIKGLLIEKGFSTSHSGSVLLSELILLTTQNDFKYPLDSYYKTLSSQFDTTENGVSTRIRRLYLSNPINGLSFKNFINEVTTEINIL